MPALMWGEGGMGKERLWNVMIGDLGRAFSRRSESCD